MKGGVIRGRLVEFFKKAYPKFEPNQSFLESPNKELAHEFGELSKGGFNYEDIMPSFNSAFSQEKVGAPKMEAFRKMLELPFDWRDEYINIIIPKGPNDRKNEEKRQEYAHLLTEFGNYDSALEEIFNKFQETHVKNRQVICDFLKVLVDNLKTLEQMSDFEHSFSRFFIDGLINVEVGKGIKERLASLHENVLVKIKESRALREQASAKPQKPASRPELVTPMASSVQKSSSKAAPSVSSLNPDEQGSTKKRAEPRTKK
ncbi:MAG: hypothetical protein ACHQJ6_04460 [Candidatus Berkiellales bacterium]